MQSSERPNNSRGAFTDIAKLLEPVREALAKMREELAGAKMWEDAQKGASIAVESAIRAGAKAALEGKDISEAWRQALYNATLDALVQAFMNQGWMNMLQPLLNQLAGAILSSDEGAIPGIMAQIAAVIEAISRHMDNLGPIAEELRRLFGIVGEAAQPVDDTAKRLEEASKNVASSVRGALQAALTAEDPVQAWRESLYRSTLDALVSALLESEVIRSALKPLQDALAEAIASGNVEGILEAVGALSQAFSSIAPALEAAREALKGVFGEGGGQGNVVGGFARSVTDAVREGLRSALTGEDWQTALSQRLRNAILDAVLNATISEALVQGTLGPIMDSLVEAIGAGNWQAVSVLSSMLAQGAQSLVEILSQSLSPLAGQFAVLHQAAEKAAQGLEAVSSSVTNLPSWYKLAPVQYQAAAPVMVVVEGNVVGVDDLASEIDRALRRARYSSTGGWV